MIWCLHGAVGQAADWNEFSRSLAAQNKVSRAVEVWRFLECEGLSLTEWAAAFNAEVRAAGEKENILVGYSMGGRLALHALLQAPELWQKAIIVSAHPGLTEEREKLERMADDAGWAGQALTADWSQFLAKWDAQGVLQGAPAPDPDPRIKLVNRRRAIARSFMEWSLGKQADLSARFSEISCPVLWLTGSRDLKFTQLAQQVVPLFRNGSHELLETGHRLPWEDSTAFFNSVEVFLNRD